jgi:hypothetical protein
MMKKYSVLYLIVTILFVTSCLSDKQAKSLTYINSANNYPEKEVLLTDIAEVAYLCLHSDDDDYLYQGTINYLTENTIVIHDRSSGSILFFSKDGKPKSRFNRKGQGPEEYMNVHRVFYNEATDEVFISGTADMPIQVYSSTGTYKRKIALPQSTRVVNDIISFDDSSFLFYDVNIQIRRFEADFKHLTDSDMVSSFYLISKIDGAVLDHFELHLPPIFLGITIDGIKVPSRFKSYILKNKDGASVCNPENDTVFLYSKDKSLLPMIRIIPSVASKDPMTYMNNCLDVGNYQFMDLVTVRAGDEGLANFPVNSYMRDKQTGEIFRQKFLLPDYEGEKFVIIPSVPGRFSEYGTFFDLDLVELKQAFRENKLSGRLKELVATLNEEKDNNVFVLITFKNP